MWRAGVCIGAIPWSDQDCLSDLDFTLLEEDEEKLQRATTNLEREAGKVGLRISAKKSTIMHINAAAQIEGITVRPQQVEKVEKFTYLDSMISQNEDAEADIKCCIRKMATIFRRMNNICSSPSIFLKINFHLLASTVIPTAIYASKTWKASTSINKKLDVFQQRCLMTDTTTISQTKRCSEGAAHANSTTSSHEEDSNWLAMFFAWRTIGS